MNKKLQVFVSSTYTDLIEERRVAIDAILDAGHIPAGMELFKAGKPQVETIHKWIDESDVYLLILGGRYGSIEEISGLSYIELEYKYAISQNIPTFAIVLTNEFLEEKAISLGKSNIFEKDNINKFILFKKEVESDIVYYAKNIEQIAYYISPQINTFINDDTRASNLVGFIRNPQKIFKNIEEADIYMGERIKSAKNNILDLTWKDFYPNPVLRNHNTYMSSQNDFLKIIKEKLVQGIAYRHIFTFPPNKKERIQRVQELIQYDSYTCGFFKSNSMIKPFPKLHFIIIDNEEALFISSNYNNYLCSIRNRELIGILTAYYQECWSLCLKIKDYDGIHQENLNRGTEVL